MPELVNNAEPLRIDSRECPAKPGGVIYKITDNNSGSGKSQDEALVLIETGVGIRLVESRLSIACVLEDIHFYGAQRFLGKGLALMRNC